jgi:hypothetical protein
MADQPSVSSLRVEKHGKSKFTPVVGGERRKATLQAAETLPPTLAAIIPEPEVVEEESSLLPVLEQQPSAAAAATTITTIEGVAARRERRKSIQRSETRIPTSAATLINFTKSEKRVTMAHFLKDTGTGMPMAASSGPNTARKTTSSSIQTRSKQPLPPRSVSTTITPQVRIVNGEIVVDEHVATLAASITTPDYPMDVVNESGKHLTSHAFVKTIGNNRWSREETDLFYEALSMCGTDFAMISLLFPRRSREQVKGKYKVEERSNPARVALHLKKRKPLDIEWLERAQVEREF